MATTLFNLNILEAAVRLKDQRTDPSPSGDTGMKFSSVLLSRYQNRAVRDFLTKALETLGEKAFATKFPEYVKTGSAITLTDSTTYGSTPLPTDAQYILDLVKSDRTVKFFKPDPLEVENIRSGQSGLIVPSATRPVFWQEQSTIYTLGLTSGNVIPRYIRTHADITVVTGASGNGKFYATAANMSYTASTRILVIAAPLGGYITSAEIGKPIMFRSASITYGGIITGIVIAIGTTLYLTGDALPAVNIGPDVILDLIITDSALLDTDLKLNPNWFGDIVDRMVNFGLADAKAGII